MKTIFLVTIISLSGLAQYSQEDIELYGVVFAETLLLAEGIDSSKIDLNFDDGDLDAIKAMAMRNFVAATSWRGEDLLYSALWGVGSGISLALYESHMYGYTYPNIPNGFVKDYLTYRTEERGMWNQSLQLPKTARFSMYFCESRAHYRAMKYFGGNQIYAALFTTAIRWSIATLARNEAKYGRPFHGIDDVGFVFHGVVPF